METDSNGLEVLDRAECLRLLSHGSLGRVAVSMSALPVILPVNYLLDGELILIRTGAGTKLAAAARNAVVAFEVDEGDPIGHTGWSVSVTGTAKEITDRDDLERIATLPLPHWAPNGVGHVIALSTDLVTGRRIPYGHARHRATD
jgi:nitroimidazol reductase NimA-like FMN-containing flavoprotein (pyridoxamine 5'-phosphate oxidase superfamily)